MRAVTAGRFARGRDTVARRPPREGWMVISGSPKRDTRTTEWAAWRPLACGLAAAIALRSRL